MSQSRRQRLHALFCLITVTSLLLGQISPLLPSHARTVAAASDLGSSADHVSLPDPGSITSTNIPPQPAQPASNPENVAMRVAPAAAEPAEGAARPLQTAGVEPKSDAVSSIPDVAAPPNVSAAILHTGTNCVFENCRESTNDVEKQAQKRFSGLAESAKSDRAQYSTVSLIPGVQATQITAEIPQRLVQEPGELFFYTEFTFQYQGGKVLLAANADGTGSTFVDDRLYIYVTHADNTLDGRRVDYFDRCGWGNYWLAPIDISALFGPGTNRVEVLLLDACGTYVYSTPLWLSNRAPLDDSSILNTNPPKGDLPPDPRVCGLECQKKEAVYSVGDPINTLTGATDYSTVDLSFPALGGQMVFQRSYSSLATKPVHDHPRLRLDAQPGYAADLADGSRRDSGAHPLQTT